MPIRKIFVAGLIAAFSFATTPSFACTGISLKAERRRRHSRPHARIRLPHAVEGARRPRRQGDERHAARRRQGPHPIRRRYGFVGANALGLPVILDGINDQGLSVGLFYFPGYAKYTDVTAENKAAPSPRRSSASGRSPISPPWMRCARR